MIVRALPDFNSNSFQRILTKFTPPPLNDGLFYFNSGSNAIKFFLSLNGKRRRVGIQVFTCVTVLKAIKVAEDIPVFMETNDEYFTTTYDIVKKYINQIDILILSHICGIPNPDYLAIKELCKNNNIVLLDDLCQTYHAKIGNELLEDISDNYVYSFFYDKPISATKGGALKVSDDIRPKAEEEFLKLPQESNSTGMKNLHRLYWMNKLLQPEVYKKDFRTWCSWELFILGVYPKHFPLRVLQALLNPSLSLRLSKFMLKPSTQNTIFRMSDIQIRYIQNCMSVFSNNNGLFADFLDYMKFDRPKYFKDNRITCSIAKRVILPSKYKEYIDNSNIELGLYNWSELIDDSEEYSCKSIIKNNINIPMSTVWYR